MASGVATLRAARTLLGVTGLAVLAIPVQSAPLAAQVLRQIKTISLPGVQCRIDHMALDANGQRLFLVALGNNTVEVIDLRAGRRIRSLTGFSEPQGVGFVASPPRLFVADVGDGSVSMLDAISLKRLKQIPLADDADNVRVDAAAQRVYVGFGNGGLATLDAATGDVLGRVILPAHPESFQLAGEGPRVFVNVPGSGEVAAIDRTKGVVVAHWPLGDAQANFPMGLDPAGNRLFIGCRRPAEVLVLDATSGKQLGELAIAGDTDDLFFDVHTSRLFASCGAGFLDVIDAPAAGALHEVGRIPTAAGARTSLFDAASRRLFLAVPHRGAQAAEVRIFAVAQ